MLVNTPQPQDLQVRHGDLALLSAKHYPLKLGSSSQVMSLAHDTYSEHETFSAWRDQGPGILPWWYEPNRWKLMIDPGLIQSKDSVCLLSEQASNIIRTPNFWVQIMALGAPAHFIHILCLSQTIFHVGWVGSQSRHGSESMTDTQWQIASDSFPLLLPRLGYPIRTKPGLLEHCWILEIVRLMENIYSYPLFVVDSLFHHYNPLCTIGDVPKIQCLLFSIHHLQPLSTGHCWLLIIHYLDVHPHLLVTFAMVRA